MLAFYLYPFEPNQTDREYTEEDLKDPSIVEELFDYYQILEACIIKKGWSFLTKYHGYEQFIKYQVLMYKKSYIKMYNYSDDFM